MNISYDPKYDVLYLKFGQGRRQVTTHIVNEDIALDFDGEGRLYGLEVLSASRYLDLASLLPLTVAETGG